jgi:hypothetical protein
MREVPWASWESGVQGGLALLEPGYSIRSNHDFDKRWRLTDRRKGECRLQRAPHLPEWSMLEEAIEVERGLCAKAMIQREWKWFHRHTDLKVILYTRRGFPGDHYDY